MSDSEWEPVEYRRVLGALDVEVKKGPHGQVYWSIYVRTQGPERPVIKSGSSSDITTAKADADMALKKAVGLA
jgi:hypothetical protein